MFNQPHYFEGTDSNWSLTKLDDMVGMSADSGKKWFLLEAQAELGKNRLFEMRGQTFE